MSKDLQDLVEFLRHGNTQIRQIAAENLVPYSTAQPSLFKVNQLEPIKDLKLLIKDYPPIAKDALTILINLSDDDKVRDNLVNDDDCLENLFRKVTDAKEENADLMCMLLANLAKSPSITKILTLKRGIPKQLSTSPFAIDQLLDCFVKGASGSHNPHATYDYLSYLFADLAKHSTGQAYFLAPRKEDASIIPLTKLIVFTEHASTIRRRGVANTIKNVCFSVSSHHALLTSETGGGIGLLPYILLPLMGPEEYSDEDSEGMLDECQLLPSDKKREPQNDILATHLESLLLLTTEKESREVLRDVKVYPIVRELHVAVEDEGVREGCDRLVQVLMRDEEGEISGKPRAEELGEVDEDEEIIDIL